MHDRNNMEIEHKLHDQHVSWDQKQVKVLLVAEEVALLTD